MKTKNLILLLISVLIISCGNPMNPPKNDNKIGKVIITEADKTYTVRMGSIVTNIKSSDMTNTWKNYIGGKKLSTGNNWRFEKNGDYWEDSYSKTTQRATLVGAAIKEATDGETYLMGMYYNHKMVFITGGAQFMLIYITSDGTEKGYYGGGRKPQPLPDYSTEWHPYDSFFLQGLGKLKDY